MKTLFARGLRWTRRRPRAGLALLLGAVLFVLVGTLRSRSPVSSDLTVTAQRGDLTVRLTAAGILKPADSVTYRSPLLGRDAEIVFLAPEGTIVNEGDLLIRLDTTEVRRELERAIQEQRQAEVDLQLAEVEREQGEAALDAVTHGEAALGVEESTTHLALAEKRVARLRSEYESMKPLLAEGFMTREELERAAFELEKAEAELVLARKKARVYIDRTLPRDQQRARLQLAQRQAQALNTQARAQETRARLAALRKIVEDASIYARAPGLVVHEEYLGAGTRRKVRAGDRVGSTQGLVTIPEVRRMLVECTVPEVEVHRLRPGQPAAIRLDAFPDLRLGGRVTRVGTLARSTPEHTFDDKRFDLVVEVEGGAEDLRPEMTARVDIQVGERKDVLLIPVNAVFERDGLLLAHVVGPFGTASRQVELGVSNGVLVEVTRGLKAGERLSLLDVAGGASPGPAGNSFAQPRPAGWDLRAPR